MRLLALRYGMPNRCGGSCTWFVARPLPSTDFFFVFLFVFGPVEIWSLRRVRSER